MIDALEPSSEDHFHKVVNERISLQRSEPALIDSMEPALPRLIDKFPKTVAKKFQNGLLVPLWITQANAKQCKIINYPCSDEFGLGWMRNLEWTDGPNPLIYEEHRHCIPNWEELSESIRYDLTNDIVRLEDLPEYRKDNQFFDFTEGLYGSIPS